MSLFCRYDLFHIMPISPPFTSISLCLFLLSSDTSLLSNANTCLSSLHLDAVCVGGSSLSANVVEGQGIHLIHELIPWICNSNNIMKCVKYLAYQYGDVCLFMPFETETEYGKHCFQLRLIHDPFILYPKLCFSYHVSHLSMTYDDHPIMNIRNIWVLVPCSNSCRS